MFKDIGNMMKLQREMKSIQKALKKAESNGESADGMVSATVNGEFTLVNISINEELLDKNNKQKLEKDIVAAVNKAVELSKEYAAKEMGKLTGEMNIPGLDKFLK